MIVSGVSLVKPYESFHGPKSGDELRCDQTYGTVLGQIGESLRVLEPVDFWRPAMLIRGVLDYKIKHPDFVVNVPALVADATDIAVNLHSGNASPERFEEFEDRVKALPGLVRSRIGQRRDVATVRASNPELSYDSATRLKAKTGNKNTLFIALGHGGVTAGVHTYLGYRHFSDIADSVIYPVRFSMQKKVDKEPRLTPEEGEYLRTLAAERDQVVVFDEDCSSGETIENAGFFFSGLLRVETIPLTNSSHHVGTSI